MNRNPGRFEIRERVPEQDVPVFHPWFDLGYASYWDMAGMSPARAEYRRKAYMETAEEDDEIAVMMDEGRRALYLRDRNDRGPYQIPLEEGMAQFHAWYAP